MTAGRTGATTLPPNAPELETVACNLCGGDQVAELFAANASLAQRREGRLRCTDDGLGQHGRIVRCRRCGLVYTNPRCRQGLIHEAYEQVEDPTYVAETEGRLLTFGRALDLLEQHHPVRGRLLDVGCYTGVFLQVARTRGWEVAGLEPSRWACDVAARQTGLAVQAGTLAGAPWPPAGFDVITLWDVLEHLTDPLGDLRRMAALLVPGGHLALTTVDIGSQSARWLGTRWWWLMEMHLYYFTRDTVTRLLRQAGFEVVLIEPHVRVVSLRYLWSRLAPYLGGAARLLERAGRWWRWNDWHATITGAGLMTVIARKPMGEPPVVGRTDQP
ncbi:MAG: class I SAM-dependent methyltransferase [Candidatus Omnitrophica bacterium]|nr:class I SAM-dependent methyltransferase [Candidatus Omnitrophota bacterium]